MTAAQTQEKTVFELEDKAKQHVVELAEIVDQRNRELEKATAQYDQSETTHHYIERAAAQERLDRARKRLEDTRESYAPLYARANRARSEKRLTEVIGQMMPVKDSAQYVKLLDTVAAFRRDLLGQVNALQEALDRRNALAAEATSLARSLGRDEQFRPVAILDLLTDIASTIQPPRQDLVPNTFELSMFSMNGARDGERIRFSLNLPAHGVTPVLDRPLT